MTAPTLSCCAWGLNEGRSLLRYWRRVRGTRIPESRSLQRLAGLGFQRVDITPSMLQSQAARQSLQNLNLKISCISISHEAPRGCTLDSDTAEMVDPLLAHLRKGIDHAKNRGATATYVVPGKLIDGQTRSRYAKHFAALAHYGLERGIQVAIEHFPGTALPTVKETLAFIRDIGHPNLYLLFDIGHAQISGEDPQASVQLAGDRLAYVHLDDNDGKNDLHLPLTQGIQTEDRLKAFFRELRAMDYQGSGSLEMHPKLPDPYLAIKQSKAVVEACW